MTSSCRALRMFFSWPVIAAVSAGVIAVAPGVVSAQAANDVPAAAAVNIDSPGSRPWMAPGLDPGARADLLLQKMTLAEKLQLTFSYFSSPAAWQKTATKNFDLPTGGLPYSAGYVPGIARLGIPGQWLTDAGVGVATQRSPSPRLRTALPSGIATAATWNPELAYEGGAMIGNEAYLSGFNVQLAGGMNLLRDPRNGRNFEYSGEDPLLAGIITGNQVRGIQSQHVISTLKHFAFNDQETSRFTLDPRIGEQAGRQSDLLAFEIALQIGNPGSVMCAYNRINGVYACENDWLLNQVLKTDWGFKGYVMSDWGATHSTTQAANAGLDQQSGWAFDRSPYFAGALREAVNNGYVPKERANDMARRILWALFAVGLFDNPVQGDQSSRIDFAKDGQISRKDAEESIVLLKNTPGLLPLAHSVRSVLIVGAHADLGVLSGGGSSQVYPVGGSAVPDEYAPKGFPGPKTYFPSSPLKGLQTRVHATVAYTDGKDIKAAVTAARRADVVIVFGEQWTGESIDVPDLNLPDNQNALISALAKANRKTVVVLETGGPVVMPWINEVGAVLEAWYPGTSGGDAIARVLSGEVNPSGHLPATFPVSLKQTPRPVLDGDPKLDADSHPLSDYNIEGAAVGYKWFEKKGLEPLFPFGHGLSYTTFQLGNLGVSADDSGLEIGFTVENTGAVGGQEVAQIYVAGLGWEAPKRLGAFHKVELAPGATQEVSVVVDPRLLATYDSASRQWKVAEGEYTVMLAKSATNIVQTAKIHLGARTFAAGMSFVNGSRVPDDRH